MGLTEAPLFEDVCLGETQGRAFWTHASDGIRLRLGLYKAGDPQGTVLLMPGRTEYIEKYAHSAHELAVRGYTSLIIDWRGQGLADRMLEDKRVGHVEAFSDYQNDVNAMVKAARELKLPKPWYMLAHSMGGCIGLRSLHDGLDVAAAAFTGPMWGIRISLPLQPVAFVLKTLLPAAGFGHVTPPTTVPDPYVLHAPYENNTLTRDPDMWQMMRNQVQTHPELSLGGPSIVWLREALDECNALAAMPSPETPCLTFLGTNERIVHVGRVHARMRDWPGSSFEIIADAEHEVLMERAAVRQDTFDKMAIYFEGAKA